MSREDHDLAGLKGRHLYAIIVGPTQIADPDQTSMAEAWVEDPISPQPQDRNPLYPLPDEEDLAVGLDGYAPKKRPPRVTLPASSKV